MKVTKIIEAIEKNQKIIIHRHVRPDPDAIGSQVGLKELIKHSFPEKEVYAVGEDVQSLTFLAQMDQVSGDAYHESLVIVCDTANQPRIDDERYDTGKQLIKIDHHPVTDSYGDIEWVSTDASSTSEMIVELALEAQTRGWTLNNNAARLLYAGIVGDTGRFKFPSTTVKTFQYAGELVRYDFDRSALYDELYQADEKVLRLSGYILQHFQLSDNGLCVIKLTADLLEKYDVSVEESNQLVQVVADVKGIKAWVFLIEEEDQIRVRIRSKGVIINGVAGKYNGGGHPLASGATVYSWEEGNDLVSDLEKVCRESA
ncbi:DHH family phosphoesterase [Oceanobacillus neutriphilus]|uniref:Bifunctional oligoribonuclease and PAP phosphatase NrnA n=1 Tax=Oceanobacillus neutriphilus TaxID=531815 RepID=A0ABQ2NZM6_9BACI|nr:bifunctional oligoribonuclease/PAP phosphatase NrnA [Oceanobacillus neutriphilus]GGP14542.1 bifunctional oligoribonuclease and PAP phosphatase NrnA [Oceanobacillus neutriphilus]